MSQELAKIESGEPVEPGWCALLFTGVINHLVYFYFRLVHDRVQKITTVGYQVLNKLC